MRFKRPTVIESEPAIMNNYALMGLLVVMIAFMWWSSRSRKKQMEKMEEEKREQRRCRDPRQVGSHPRRLLGPFSSTWMVTSSSLETTDGHEMYWEREMIAEIGGQPPLARAEEDEASESADVEDASDEGEAILGLDDTTSSSKDTDEQQK